MAERKKRSSSRPGWLSHRGLIAVEALLLVGIFKDFLTAGVKASQLPGYGKVLFVMALTVGILGGLFVLVERLTARTVAGTYRALPGLLPYWLVHAGVLLALYLLYASHLGIRAF